MNGRERFLTALACGVPDRIPLFETHFGLPFIRAALGPDVSPYHNVDDEVKIARLTGLDMVWSAPLGFTSFANIQQHGERYQDEWGTWYGSDESSWPGAWMENFVVNNRQEWEQLQMPDPRRPERAAQPKRALELVQGELAVVGAVRGPFSATWMLAGMENIGKWVLKEPDLLEEILGEMGRWNTEMGLLLIESGVDAIMVHDDWGMNMGTLVKPEHWRQHFLPYIAAEIETLAATGTPIIMHSDGNLNAIMDDIMQLPISALNPVQRNAGMDLAETKRRWGDRLCLIGNISASLTLAHGKPDDVELEALECMRDAGPGGGYIMAPDHSYHSAIPAANTWRVFETCKRYGEYPLDMPAIEGRIAELKAQGAGLGWATTTKTVASPESETRERRPRPKR